MSSVAAFNRPATVLLAAVLAANLLLPTVHFWPGETAAAAPDPGVQSAGANRGPPPRAGQRLAPIPLAVLPAKRVTMREPTPACLAWGPFTEVAEAESLASRLNLDSRRFEIFESQVSVRADYLVTVQAPGPRDAGKRVIEALRAHNVDSYVLEGGSASQRLAAGVFRNPRRAESQQQRLAELGYDAAVEPLDRSHRIFHLMARMPPEVAPEIPAVGACSDIAPMEQFL
jgi:hypothetical protein